LTVGPPPDVEPKRRNPWIWVSAVLAVVAAGLLIWGLNAKSDADDAQQETDQLQAQLEQGKETGSAAAEDAEAAYDEVTQDLGATTEDLAATEKDLETAEKEASQAEEDAAAAEKEAEEASSETEKAQAEADQAEAEAKAAESKAAIGTECAKAYVSALGALFGGESAETVRKELEGITATCKDALAGQIASAHARWPVFRPDIPQGTGREVLFAQVDRRADAR
jgi:DNA repair exonuclease SbcCD ATPase subunit